MTVEQCWKRLELEAAGGVAMQTEDYGLASRQRIMAAARDLALAIHDEACPGCNQEYGTPETLAMCEERARIAALPAEAGEGSG